MSIRWVCGRSGRGRVPDLTEFWTPSCGLCTGDLHGQDVSVNQMLDNAEAINKPQKVVNVLAIENFKT